MNHHLTRPRDVEAMQDAQIFEGIKQRALTALRGTIPPDELADLPKRSLKNRVAIATIDAAWHTDARKTDLEKIKRNILRSLIGERADAND